MANAEEEYQASEAKKPKVEPEGETYDPFLEEDDGMNGDDTNIDHDKLLQDLEDEINQESILEHEDLTEQAEEEEFKVLKDFEQAETSVVSTFAGRGSRRGGRRGRGGRGRAN